MYVVCDRGRVLRPLTCAEWPALYMLMRERGFPHVPATPEAAYGRFEGVEILGIFEQQRLVCGFMFGEPEEGVAFFDVVCAEDMQGLWATPRILKALFGYAFETLKLRAVWVQSQKGRPLRAALQAGFTPVTPLNAPDPVLVMTRWSVPQRLRPEQCDDDKEMNDGKFICEHEKGFGAA